MNQLLDRIVVTDSEALGKGLQARFKGLEEQKIVLAEKIKDCGRPLATFEDTFRTAFEFIGNPQKLWQSRHIEHRRMVLRLAFRSRLTYVRNEGFRTADLTLPFKLLRVSGSQSEEVVDQPGSNWALDSHDIRAGG